MPAEHLLLGFQDQEYGFQCLRTASAAAGGGADLGECLKAAAQVVEGDDESWYRAWNQLACRLEKEAMTSQEAGHGQSARSAFFRACNYFRTAEFFLHGRPEDPRIQELGTKAKNCFLSAIHYTKDPVLPVHIPFEKTTLPGYLCLAHGDQKRPLLIVQTGFDGTKEELYFFVAQEAVRRGIHCLVFEGPGQGSCVREQNLYFRPNWETVITPVIDFAVGVNHVDHQRIALMGISFGGYLVPRALAFEKRVRVGVVNGGIFDFHEVCMHGAKDSELDSLQKAKEFDEAVLQIMKENTKVRWAIAQGLYTFGCQSPSEWLKKTRDYRLEGVVERISCPMLVVESEADTKVQGQSTKLFEALVCPKTFMLFTAAEGAGEHCQIGSPALSNERIFSWLEQHL